MTKKKQDTQWSIIAANAMKQSQDKTYDRLKMAEICYTTCKEYSDKVKATNELNKEQKKQIQPMEIHRLKPLTPYLFYYTYNM